MIAARALRRVPAMTGTLGNLIRIKRGETLFRTFVYCEFLQTNCWVVLTRDVIAWRPVAHALSVILFRPRRYYVVPWSAITLAEVECSPDGLRKRVRVHWDSASGRHGSLEFSHILYLNDWVRAFSKAGVPVAGSDQTDVSTVGGFLRDYGWTVWVAAIALGAFTVSWFGHSIFTWYSLIAEVASLLLLWFVVWRVRR